MKKSLLFIVALVSSLTLSFAQPVITTELTNQTVIIGSNATFSVMVTGTGPFTYQWQFNGTNLANNIITTVAGNGNPIYAGDGGQATNTGINNSAGVAADSQGDFLITDSYSGRIWQVDTNGIINTVAGTNYNGFAGDGGLANLAKLNRPFGVALDAWGNYYIADTGNQRIRKVDANGLINTVAGNGGAAYGGDGAAATNAILNSPRGVAVDGVGNLYIADYGNNRIRKVDTNGIITTIAGTNSSGFAGDGGLAFNAKLNAPQGVAVDATGNLFIADYGNNRVRRVDISGVITTIAGNGKSYQTINDGGPAINACLSNPTGVAVDTFGYVFIADLNNNRIRQVDPNGIITTVAGNGSTTYSGDGGVATNACLFQPFGVTCEAAGSLLIADMYHSRIRRATLGRIPSLQLNSLTTNHAGTYQVVVTSPNGSVTSSVVSLAVVFTPGILTQPQSQVVSNGAAGSLGLTASGTGPLNYQWFQNNGPIVGGTNTALNYPATSLAQAGNYLCIITNNYGSVTSSIVSITVLIPPTIVTQPSNQVLVAGSSTTLVANVTGTGPFTYQWQFNGTNLSNNNNVITKVAGSATQNGFGGDGGLAISAFMWRPSGVAVDSTGNMLIVDQPNNRVRRVDTNGIINTVVGVGPNGSNGSFSGDGGAATNANLNLVPFYFNTPAGVAVDSLGNLFLADIGNNRIRKVDTNGIITTLAGTNSSGFSGDGGLAIIAKINGPSGIALDSSGNVFFADSGNNRIRKIGVNGIIGTVAGTNAAGFSGDGGSATIASLNNPYGIALDAGGNLFIADKGNNRIRKVDVNGVISSPIGNGTSGYGGDNNVATNALLNQPYGVAVDAFGDIFIADYANNCVRVVNINGMIYTLAGTGAAGNSGDGGIVTNATLYEPTSIGTDNNGNVYVGGSGYAIVRKIDLGRMPYLNLNNLTSSYAGNYDVIITSPYGSVTSSVVSLTVLLPPSITTQPAGSRVVVGSSTNYNVTVSGTGPFGYQWFTSSGRTATAFVPYVFGGSVQTVFMIDPGAGYVSTPQVHFVGGSGSGATGTAIVQSGSVPFIMMNNHGSGYYTVPPTIQIDPPPTSNSLMPNQNNATLPLLTVTGTDAINYFVVVTNNYGSVTSATVFLTVFLPPQNFSAQNVVTGFQMNLTGSPSFPYILQSATNLAPPIAWKPIRTNYADVSGNWQFTDTNLNGGQKYYRAVGQ